MGYSDLGSYGGEIKTPVLDKWAQQGARYTDFCVSPTCSVTRSMLLTGTDNPIAGLGNMGELTAPNQMGKPGYKGVLNKRVVTVAADEPALDSLGRKYIHINHVIKEAEIAVAQFTGTTFL